MMKCDVMKNEKKKRNIWEKERKKDYQNGVENRNG